MELDLMAVSILRQLSFTTSDDALGYLMRRGLARDPVHAYDISRMWGSLSVVEVIDEDVDSLESMILDHFLALFPGIQNRQHKALASEFSLFSCGSWVLKRAKNKIDFNPRPSESTLCLDSKAPSSQAERFTIISPSTVQYGETLLIKSGEKTRKIQFFSPGLSGDVCLGDHVYIVQVGQNDIIQHTWALGSMTRKRGTPILKRDINGSQFHSSMIFTLAVPDESPFIESPREEKGSQGVSVLVYNAWMMPRLWGITRLVQNLGLKFSVKKNSRAYHIPDALDKAIEERMPGVIPDVLVLCEAFCDHAGTSLKAGLKRRFGCVFETPVGGSGNFFLTKSITNGGVTVLSRYPIVETSVKLFTSEWARDDGLANKCAIRVRILKNGKPCNIIATHLQAWDYDSAIKAREGQMKLIGEMVQELDIPSVEPLIYAGDLNVCRIRTPDQYDRMLDLFNATDPHLLDDETLQLGRNLTVLQDKMKQKGYLEANRIIQPDMSSQMENDPRIRDIFTSNSIHNKLASGGPSSGDSCELLDYTLVSKVHLQPRNSKTVILSNVTCEKSYSWGKETFNDLSDHYPVLSYFTFSQ